MRKLYSIILFLLIALFSNAWLWADKLPKNIIEKPSKYDTPIDQNDFKPSKDRKKLLQWTVWSDRDNNQTYKKRDGSIPFKTLSFMEAFFVVDEKNEYVRLAQDTDANLLRLSKNAVDFGWIHKSKILLWQHCLITKAGRINKKAMILNTIDHLKKSTTGKPDLVEFRKEPTLIGKKSGKKSRLFQFFFVFKEENDMILLSRNDRINTNDSQEDIKEYFVGWAPISRVTEWDHRKAVEPNWEASAYLERQNKKKAKFFVNIPDAKRYKKGQKPKIGALWDDDNSAERRIGEWRRFPLLRTDRREPDTFVAGIMGEVIVGDEGQIVSANEIAEIQNKLDSTIVKTRNIDIVFVIDGTQSMGPYFKAMRDAIKDCIDNLIKKTDNVYRFGAVIYRDFAEKDRKLEVYRLRDPSAGIIEFLNPKKSYDNADDDIPEAVNFGLKAALRRTGLEQNNNVIVLIGDAGNHRRSDATWVSNATIIKGLASFNCHFLVFQVANKAHSSYDDFITDNITIANETSNLVYNKIVDKYGGVIQRPRIEKEGNKFKVVSNASTAFVIGADEDGFMSPQFLSKTAFEEITALDRRTDQLISRIKKLIDGDKIEPKPTTKPIVNKTPSITKEVSAFSPAIMNFLRTSGISQKQLEILKKENFQLYTKAASTFKVKGQTYPLFKQVLFLSREELYEMIEQIKRLDRSGSQERRRLAETWKQILKSYTGASDEEVSDMTLSELNEQVFGLPGTNEFLKNVRLQDITDENKFPDVELRNYVSNITSKLKKLRTILNRPETEYKYCFRSNEITFYWIDEDLIP